MSIRSQHYRPTPFSNVFRLPKSPYGILGVISTSRVNLKQVLRFASLRPPTSQYSLLEEPVSYAVSSSPLSLWWPCWQIFKLHLVKLEGCEDYMLELIAQVRQPAPNGWHKGPCRLGALLCSHIGPSTYATSHQHQHCRALGDTLHLV